MKPADQTTLKPDKKHWFKAGGGRSRDARFSTIARDALDGFKDLAVVRMTKIAESNL